MRGVGAVVAVIAIAATAGAQERPAVVIGGPDSKASELIDPRAFVFTGKHIVVLEKSAPFLRLLSTNGSLIQTLGRGGAGPGEFGLGLSVAYDSAARQLLVFDGSNSRVTYFNLQDTLALHGTRRTSVIPNAGCVVDGIAWIVSYGPKLLQELLISGGQTRIGRSYGEARSLHPLASHAMVKSRVAQGSIVCDSRAKTAYVLSRTLGEVQSVALTTGSQQSFKLAGFIPAALTPLENGLRLSPPPDGIYDEIVGGFVTPTGIEAVIGHVTREFRDPGEYAYFQRVAITPNGTQRLIGRSRWRPVGSAPDGVYCYTIDPAPTLARFASGRCP